MVADILAVYRRKMKEPHMICNQSYVFDASPLLVKNALKRDAMGTGSSSYNFLVLYG